MQTEDRKIVWAVIVVAALALLMFAFAHFQPLREWQELIAGLLALIAAGIGAAFIQRQINASDQQEENRRGNRFFAARATLPLTLSAITEYAVESSKSYESLLATSGPMGIPKSSAVTFPALPTETISDFRTILELGGDIARPSIKSLLLLLQIHRARVRGTENYLRGTGSVTVMTTANVESEIILSAELYARAAALYDFGRFRSELPELVSPSRVRTALDQLGFDDSTHPRLYKRADQWQPIV